VIIWTKKNQRTHFAFVCCSPRNRKDSSETTWLGDLKLRNTRIQHQLFRNRRFVLIFSSESFADSRLYFQLLIRDIVVGSYQTYGNNIAASASFMAFPWEHAGSSLAVLPIDDCGRKSKTMPLLHAHTDTVTDLAFSPFDDGLLATGSQDGLVKLWHIPEGGLKESLLDAECTFSHRQKRVETVCFHPTTDFMLCATSIGSITLYDLTSEKEVFCNNEHPDVIQSLSWKQDGTLLATSTKDKKVRIVDPRSNEPIVMQADSHQNIKDSRVSWLGVQDRIITTGFDANRIRQVIIRDVRNLSKAEKVLDLDCSTGILMTLFDSDTNMMFLAGKGDTTINFLEVTDREPFLVEGKICFFRSFVINSQLFLMFYRNSSFW
jgi:coronin-7